MNIGVLGRGALARVEDRGVIFAGDVELDWWIGADDGWHFPADEASTRRTRPGPAPVVETAMRVPGGEVVQRVYGVACGSGVATVVEFENRSPAPVTAVATIRVGREGVVELDGTVLRVDGAVVLVVPRTPGAWAAAASTREIVTGGGAHTGPVTSTRGPIELALLFPVPHRTSLRFVMTDTPVDGRDLPAADAVARGWERQLERGLRAELPPPVGDLVDAARADLLLAPRRDPAVVAALEDWGFDAEAAAGWAELNWAARRQARKRGAVGDPWVATRAADPAREPARFLTTLRSVLVSERPGAIELLPGFPPEWLGQPVAVDGAPLRSGGTLSFAVRWHGARPALLWDAPAGVELRAAALDPEWSSTAPTGEVLLAAPPVSLLAMGTAERAAGEPVEAPGQFS